MPLRLASLFLLAVGILTPAIFAGDSTVPATTISWSTDYAQASNAANDQGKMLLILFSKPDDPQTQRLESETFANAEVQRKMQGFICLRLPLDSKLTLDGKEIVLVQHPSFSEMLGRPGVAIVDYAHRDPKLHGYVVSTFPLTGGLFYSPAEMQVILDLPPGTLTQRTLIYAVRIHPEKPASALGQPDDRLLSEAENHSHHQARILLQGHHGWEARGRGSPPSSVVHRGRCAQKAGLDRIWSNRLLSVSVAGGFRRATGAPSRPETGASATI